MVGEEVQRLLHVHIQHIGDVLALVADLQRLAVEARALALLARHPHVGQEVHLDALLAVPLARLAAPALDVEAEPPDAVAAHLGLRRGRRTPARISSNTPDVGRRVRARRAPDGILRDVDDLVQVLQPSMRS